MARGRQARVQKNGIACVLVQGAPGLVGDVELGENAAPVEEEGLLRVEVEMVPSRI